jgi:hypothetical protein
MAQDSCPVCGRRYNEDSRYCDQCGRRRSGNAPTSMWIPRDRAIVYIGLIAFLLLEVIVPRGSLAPWAQRWLAPMTTSSHSPRPSGASGSEGNRPTLSTKPSPQLAVSSWRCDADGRGFEIAGEVKNTSGSSFNYLQPTVTMRAADGRFVTYWSGFTDYNPLLPGQTSPFSISVNLNPAIKKADLSFTEDRATIELWGRTRKHVSCTNGNSNVRRD